MAAVDSSALSALSALLSEHRSALLDVFTRLGVSSSTPRDTVDARLRELHNDLVGAVRAQRERAQAELDAVAREIEDVREAGKRMRRELGEAETASTLIDAGGETLLQLLDRLRHQHSQLEQVHSARLARVQSLYAQLRQAREVLGDNAIDSALVVPLSDATIDDLSADRLAAVQKEAHRCEDEITRRQASLLSHLQEIEQLWATLEMTPPAPASPVDLAALTDAQFSQALVAHLSTEVSFSLPITSAVFAQAERIRTDLETELARREREIQSLYDELYVLWARMEVPEEDQEVFIEHWKGTSQASIEAYRAEHSRMLELRAANMVLFIERERIDLIRICDELYLSPAERPLLLRAEVQPSEAALEAHEQERQRLDQVRIQREPVLSILVRYFVLLNEAAELDASAADPNRFKGVRGDPGRLLREEKTRKRIAKERPKLEAELMTIIPSWEEQYGQSFTVNGVRYLDELAERVGGGRRAALPARGRTPAPGERAKTPGPGDRARTPGPGERSKTPAPGSIRPQHTGGSSVARPLRSQHTDPSSAGSGIPTTIKRQQTGPTSQTPASAFEAKRARTNSVSAASGGQLTARVLPPSWDLPTPTPTSSSSLFAAPTPSSIFAAPSRTTFRPRPSAASVGSSVVSSGSARTVSTSATSVSDYAK